MTFEELENGHPFMFRNDVNHYVKLHSNSYFCYEDRSSHYMSGRDLAKLESAEVIKIRILFNII